MNGLLAVLCTVTFLAALANAFAAYLNYRHHKQSRETMSLLSIIDEMLEELQKGGGVIGRDLVERDHIATDVVTSEGRY